MDTKTARRPLRLTLRARAVAHLVAFTAGGGVAALIDQLVLR